MKEQNKLHEPITRMGRFVAYMRIAFGLVWLLDAVLKFNPSFYNGMLNLIQATDGGGPNWLNGWYNFWITFLGSAPHFFTIVVIVVECFIAFALLSGFSRKSTYLIGAVFSFLLWGIAEGFGGIFIGGETDPNAGIIYALLFMLFYFVDNGSVLPAKLAFDTYLEKRISWWHLVSRGKKV
jgi:hypothetical protein